MPEFDLVKVMEGVIFQGCLLTPKLVSDLDLGGPDDLKSDLRGHLRSLRSKIQFSEFFKFDHSGQFLRPYSILNPLDRMTSNLTSEAI